MESVLIVIHLIIVIALAGTVLLQRSEGGALGMGGGSPTGFMTGRGQANLLSRTTAILGAAFFATSLILSIVAARGRAPQSVLDKTVPAQTAPAQPGEPAKPGSVLDQLRNLPAPGAPTEKKQ